MTCSVGGQDKSPDPTLGLAILAGKMALSCPFGITRCVPQKNKKQCSFPYNKSFIDQVCSVKMVGYWSRPFCMFWTHPASRAFFISFCFVFMLVSLYPACRVKRTLPPEYPSTEQAWSKPHICITFTNVRKCLVGKLLGHNVIQLNLNSNYLELLCKLKRVRVKFRDGR